MRSDGPPEERIIQGNAPIPSETLSSPAWPADREQEAMSALMGGAAMGRIFQFNKCHSTERYCPGCHLHYKKPENPVTISEKEQELSGICSTKCFQQMVGPEQD
jgi:hypothetical protein